ncbi:MAG: M48 family metalloprotease, partial [Promethearchaeota archaeon]
EDLLTGIMGAFSIYLIIGSLELKEHEVINKVIWISAITYNVLFAAGLFDFFYNKIVPGAPIDLLDKMFSLSLWLILILGFIFFGRKYIIVWRFMSPQYITLALYLLSWVLITTIGFIFDIQAIFKFIFPVLIVTNLVVYVFTGAFIDKFLGVKQLSTLPDDKAKELLELVRTVQERLGLDGNVKVGFGQYPIINAMAYGPVFDKRICIIAPDLDLPLDEIEAIIAHELGHLQCHHPEKLLIINAMDLLIRWIIGFIPGFYIPATYYDITFGMKFMLFGVELDLIWYLLLNMAIFAFLYVFVRVMEANADFIVKRAGMGRKLAKALYNLESFYALGKQVGLNVMLLADEKLDTNHKMLNYISAARALKKQLFKPSRGLALTVILNSHPPTFLRIANLLLPADGAYSSWQETTLPLKFVRSANVSKFSEKTRPIRELLDEITRGKFIELFHDEVGGSLSKFLEGINIHGNKDDYLENQTIVVNKLDKQSFHMKLDKIIYNDSIMTPYVFEGVKVNAPGDGRVKVSPDESQLYMVNAGDRYELPKKKIVKLKKFIDGSGFKDLSCEIESGDGTIKKEKYARIKNQITREFLSSLVGKFIFLNVKDAVEVYLMKEFVDAEKIKDSVMVCRKYGHDADVRFTAGDFRFSRGRVLMFMHSDDKYIDRYYEFFSWCKETTSKVFVELKKPVNNDYLCIIESLNQEEKKISIQDDFGTRLEVELKKIHYLLLENSTVSLKEAKQESFIQRFAYNITESKKMISWIPRK